MPETNGNGNGNGHSYVAEYQARPGVVPLSERMPPRNLHAEQAFLGSILCDNEVLRTVKPPVVVGDFALDSHQVVYQAMLDIDESGRKVDPVTLREELVRTGHWEAPAGQ